MRINGKLVINAKRKLTFRITNDDVKKGNTKDPGGCAAALSLMRHHKAKAARVHIGRTYVDTGKHWLRFDTSASLRSEVIAFDRGGTFEPGVYTIDAISPSERERYGRRQGSNKSGARDKNGKRISKIHRTKPHIITGVRQRGANH